MSAVHFIGGEKGGVGKSVISRLFAQYHVDRGKPFVILDSDLSH
ncbi:MAG: mobilization protein, partial [Acidobacteriota bacterium]|nr:mobilization protein [Acidobacteriota bacterium]